MYIKFIEDDFLDGARLDPLTLDRPDPRPTVRENVSILGDLANDFDFNQSPRPPEPLPVHPATTLTSVAPFGPITIFASPGDRRATVQWRAPFTDGGSPITGSKITAYVNGVPVRTTTFDSPATTQTVTGLTNGTIYTFRAAAINAHGVGLSSNMTAPIQVGVPSPPTGLTATPGNGRAILRWQPPSPHGAPLTGYTITLTRRSASVAPRIWRTKFPRITVALPNGTAATFRVVATNAFGPSATSVSGPFTVGAPLAPANVKALRVAIGSLRVTAKAPPDNGARIGRYTAKCTSGTGVPKTARSTRSTIVVSGLTSGATYRCVVTAANNRGVSHPSHPSPAVTA